MRHQHYTTQIQPDTVVQQFTAVFDDYNELSDFLLLNLKDGKMDSRDVVQIAEMFLDYKGALLPLMLRFEYHWGKFEKVTARIDAGVLPQN